MTDDTLPREEGEEVAQTSAAAGGGGVKVGGIEIYNDEQLPYVGGLVSAIVLLVALTTGDQFLDDDGLTDIDNSKYYTYGLVLASVTMIFSLVGWVLTHFTNLDARILSMNNYFLFVWNFVGACFMTFGEPFKNTGNGYFGSWGMVVFATMGLGVSVAQAKEASHGVTGPLFSLFATSIIVVVAISTEGLGSDNQQKGESIYALVVACLSIFLALGLIKKVDLDNGQADMLAFGVLACFAILWIVAASLVTFKGPFTLTGNGYFASWGAAIASTVAAVKSKRGD